MSNKLSVAKCFIKIIFPLLGLFFYTFVSAGSYEDFFKAIEQDNAQIVSYLLKRGFDPNTPNEQGQRPLILSINFGSNEVSKVLIHAKGSDIDQTNLQDESPLMMAAFNGNFEMAELLIEMGASVNKTGWTPLHYAATKGNIKMMKLLLAHSAYIDAESPNGTTPLMMAARYATAEATQLLMDEGADPTLSNSLNLTALDFAKMTNNSKLVSYVLTQTSIWKLSHP
jgi:hypothetical protein